MTKLKPKPKKNVRTQQPDYIAKESRSLHSNEKKIVDAKPKAKSNQRKKEPDTLTQPSKAYHSTKKTQVDIDRRKKKLEQELAKQLAADLKEKEDEEKQRELYMQKLDSFTEEDIDEEGFYKPKKRKKKLPPLSINLEQLAAYARHGFSVAWLAEQLNTSESTLNNRPYIDIIKTARHRSLTTMLQSSYDFGRKGNKSYAEIWLNKRHLLDQEGKAQQPIEFNIKFVNSDGTDA